MYSIYKYGDLIPVKEFVEEVNNNFFTDYDGSGAFCDGKTEEHENLSCREIYNGRTIIDPKWTHVVWYNK